MDLLKHWGWIAVGSWIMFGCIAHAANDVEQFAGTVPLEAVTANSVETHQLITGRVKRVRGEVRPESAEYVRGLQQQETFELATSVEKEQFLSFYRDQFTKSGQILFECGGRDCGPSNYWSNQVFGKALLYGPTEHQYYMLAKLSDASGVYISLYFAERGTGKRLLHLETISGVSDEIATDSRLIKSMLKLQGRFVFTAEPQILEAIRDAVNEDSLLELALVAHSPLRDGESFDAGLERTQRKASATKAILAEMGTDSGRIRAFGAGPIAPALQAQRLELVRLN